MNPEPIRNNTGGIDSRTAPGGGPAAAFKAFHRSLLLLQNPKLALPLFLYFLLKLGILALYISNTSLNLSPVWAFFIRGLTPENINHYPIHPIMMQTILGRLDILMDIFVFVIFQGVTIILVSAAFARRSVSLREGFKTTTTRYFHLVIAAIAASVIMLVFVNAPAIIAEQTGRHAGTGITAAGTIIGLVIQALLLFTAPFILLERIAGFRAIGRSIRFAGRSIGTSVLLVIVPFILTLPTMLLMLRADMIAFRISPDFLIYIQVAGEIMQLFASYLVIGGATIYFISKGKTQ